MVEYSRSESARGYFSATEVQMKQDMAAGDIRAVHASWLWFMNEAGKCYIDKTDQAGQADNAEAARLMTAALCAIGDLIPDGEKNRPAKVIIDALLALVVEAPTGKRTHPLFDHSGWAGTTDKGSLRQQVIIGRALGCLALLEHFKHPRGASEIADALKAADFPVANGGTVRQWKRRLSGWPIAFEAYAHVMDGLPKDIATHGIKNADDAAELVRKAIKIAVTTTL